MAHIRCARGAEASPCPIFAVPGPALACGRWPRARARRGSRRQHLEAAGRAGRHLRLLPAREVLQLPGPGGAPGAGLGHGGGRGGSPYNSGLTGQQGPLCWGVQQGAQCCGVGCSRGCPLCPAGPLVAAQQGWRGAGVMGACCTQESAGGHTCDHAMSLQLYQDEMRRRKQLRGASQTDLVMPWRVGAGARVAPQSGMPPRTWSEPPRVRPAGAWIEGHGFSDACLGLGPSGLAVGQCPCAQRVFGAWHTRVQPACASHLSMLPSCRCGRRRPVWARPARNSTVGVSGGPG